MTQNVKDALDAFAAAAAKFPEQLNRMKTDGGGRVNIERVPFATVIRDSGTGNPVLTWTYQGKPITMPIEVSDLASFAPYL